MVDSLPSSSSPGDLINLFECFDRALDGLREQYEEKISTEQTSAEERVASERKKIKERLQDKLEGLVKQLFLD